MFDTSRLKLDLLGIGLLAGLVFCVLSLVSWNAADAPATNVYPVNESPLNWCGPAGAATAATLLRVVGGGAWLMVVGLGLLTWRILSRRPLADPALRVAGVLCLVTAGCVCLHRFLPAVMDGHPVGSGGYVGALGSLMLARHFSLTGTLILVGTLTSVGLLLLAERGILQLLMTLAVTTGSVGALPLRPVLRRRRRQRAVINSGDEESADAEAAADDDSGEPEPETPDLGPPPEPAFKVNRPAALSAEKPAGFEGVPADGHGHFELPPLDILDDAEPFPFEELAEAAQEAAATLEATFADFKLNVKVTEIDTGPVVTQFELDLEKGLRVKQITALEDDLAVALRVPAVRVVSPIPGKNTVGVEVPNSRRVNVRMRELIETSGEDSEKFALPLFLGKDVSGRPLNVDMAKMPHLLIAGRTGTGKSVCLNTLICSMLMTRSPDEVKMLMIDPKMVELSPYKTIPHLMHPVITDMKQAEAVLAWAVDKMEERYDMLAKCGVRHLEGYNKLGKAEVLKRMGINAYDEVAESIPEHMPYIVVVADEIADMMMTCGKDVEAHIVRLAQKSRAVGIHLVLATQKPTVDVLTGLIKSNMPARLSFQVASKQDSRVVLDTNGAEALLGYGDMLFLAPATSTLTRAQGTYVSDEEVHDVTGFFGDHEPQYSEELKNVVSGGPKGEGGIEAMAARDPLYLDACDVVVRERLGSCSRIGRDLSIGYGRSARMVEWMEEDGILGPHNGAKPREVLITEEEWYAMREGVGG